MAYTPDINEVAIVMSRLQHNYSQLANNWFNVFYDPVAREEVTVTWYDEDGNLDTYTLPNRAWDFRYIINGTGSPEGVVTADVGSVYQDTTNGDGYIKKVGASANTGWVKFATLADLDNLMIKGAYNPEGQLSAPIATLFGNTVDGQLWIKESGSGNTGWSRVSFNQAYVDQQIATRANLSLSNLNATGEKHFLNKQQISSCILEAPSGVCTASTNTITVATGVKFLFPNGRNTDGTLKNVEHTLTQARIFTNSSTSARTGLTAFFTYDSDYESWLYYDTNKVYYSEVQPISPASNVYAMWFDIKNNTWKHTDNGSAWTTTIACPFCTFDIAEGGNINNLVAHSVVSLVKHSEFIEKVGRYVVKTGDTMTGALTVNSTVTANNIVDNGNLTVSGSTSMAGVTATSITDSALTASRVITSGSGGLLQASSITTTELGYLSGASSNIQAQLNAEQAKIYLKTAHLASNGRSGYNIWSNGYCQQWGRGQENTTVTLAKKFRSDMGYGVIVSLQGRSSGPASAESFTQASFILRVGEDETGSSTVFWFAHGYLANGEY